MGLLYFLVQDALHSHLVYSPESLQMTNRRQHNHFQTLVGIIVVKSIAAGLFVQSMAIRNIQGNNT